MMFSLMQLLVPILAQYEQRCEIANAFDPVFSFIGGNILGLAPDLLVIMGLVLAFALMLLAASRTNSFILRALAYVVGAGLLITVVPSLMGAIGPEAC